MAAGIVAAAVLIPIFSRRSPLRVHVTSVVRGSIRSFISTNGKIEPVQNFEAHSPMATTVRRLFVKEGDHVRKGQLLLQLDDADIRSQAARAQAQLKSAQADQSELKVGGTQEEVLTLDAQLTKARSERDLAQHDLDALRRLQQQGAASPGEVKQAEDALQRAQADLNLAEQKQKNRYSQPEVAKVQAQSTEAEAAYEAAEDALARSNVHALFDGIVYSLPVKQGTFVQAGDLLLQEADLTEVVARVFVDEPDVGRLTKGQRVELTWDALPGRTWNGTVSTVPTTVKLRGTRNVGEATCSVDNHDLKLLPNVNVSVSIITAEHNNVLTLPRDALRLDDEKSYVYQVVDDHLKRRDIQIAAQNLTRVEIASGLDAGDVVAVNSEESKPLTEDAAVTVVH
ncbi:MAG TPA: efflux RND transporter periplasmic adaptor subunit [Candidatus Sulfotelmatobacter sp.]|nr:efflux RND transporter periplasmic adaptor subunit [Candidatus Sulfotelmatobacter sp.]